MANLGIVFLTGLTTGGLSCLAVQGGLLASSVARQAEQTIQKKLAAGSVARPAAKKGKKAHSSVYRQAAPAAERRANYAASIALFLIAKLVTYTILGFLLGWLGSMLQLTPFMTAVLQIAIGVFMVGSALRMFNVHPFFRLFALEPPSFVTRYIRKRAKKNTNDLITPLFLGALTVLIPCGVTQIMMATAIGTGDPLEGAAIMFAFTLGASPLFFALAYLATQIGKTLEARFVQVVASVVLVLGLVSIDGGLTLLGAPLPFSRFEASGTKSLASANAAPVAESAQPTNAPAAAANLAQGALPSAWKVLSSADLGAANSAEQAAQPAVQGNVVTIHVTDYSYEPQVVQAPANQLIKLKLVTNDVYG
ncbi:MAG: sulfite exporter TauE/SafE family protein [Caldilinea sp. CFX5]|nr:sulfite exporter TauE/SafE family protein [Caldilinea sp. CFX5]